jgi:hypothetical protein
MSLRRATAVLLLVGLVFGGSLCWKYYISSPAGIRAQQQRQMKVARKRLYELREEMKEVMRSTSKLSPQERQAAVAEWQKAHREEIRALQEQAFGLPSSSRSTLTMEQRIQNQRHKEMQQQMDALLRQGPSADRDNKIALLRDQMQAEQKKWRQEKDREMLKAGSPEEEARRAAWVELNKQRSDLLLSLRQASSEDRQKALEKWEQENGAKLRAIAQPRPILPAKPGEK